MITVLITAKNPRITAKTSHNMVGVIDKVGFEISFKMVILVSCMSMLRITYPQVDRNEKN